MTRFPMLLISLVLMAVAPGAALAQRNPPPPAVSPEVVSDLLVRLLQLEQANQQLTGQVEELRFQNQQLSKQIQIIQDDLTLRVTRLEQGGAGMVSDEGAPAAPTAQAPQPAPTRQAQPAAPTYDPRAPLSAPVAKQPDMSRPPSSAAGAATPLVTAPQAGDGGFTLRTDASGKPLPPDPNAPPAPAIAQTPPPPAPAPRAAPTGGPVTSAPVAAPPVSVTLPQGTPKAQYDFAFDFLRRNDYARGESALRAFVKANPKDPLAGNAQFWVGESLYARGDYQAAAVEYMNGYQQYPKSNKGPENLLKLGMAMAHLNQTQGACTALGRITKEYPDAEDRIRKTAQSERAKLKCA